MLSLVHTYIQNHKSEILAVAGGFGTARQLRPVPVEAGPGRDRRRPHRRRVRIPRRGQDAVNFLPPRPDRRLDLLAR